MRMRTRARLAIGGEPQSGVGSEDPRPPGRRGKATTKKSIVRCTVLLLAAAALLVFAVVNRYIGAAVASSLNLRDGGTNAVAANVANVTKASAAASAGRLDRRPSWVPITEDERRAYRERERRVCGRPFRHCCLGQGRQLGSRHGNASRLEVKWSEPLADLSALLEYMSGTGVPCSLWFVGQSTSGDHAIGAICELTRDWGYELDPGRCVPYRNERWNESSAFNCTAVKPNGLEQLYYLENPSRSSCPKVTVAQWGGGPLWQSLQRTEFFRSGGVMLANRGMHCNARGCVADWLRNFTERVLPKVEEKGWRVIWRETERQHFASPTGYMGGDALKREPCAAIARTGGDYRNEEAESFLRGLGPNRTVPIVRLADATAPLHFMHAYDAERGVYDCTHYVYTPWRFRLTWDGILKALKELKQRV